LGDNVAPRKNWVVGEVKPVLEFPATIGDEIGEHVVLEGHWYTLGRATSGGRTTFIDEIVVAGPGLLSTTCMEAVPRIVTSVAVPARSLMVTTVI
jgi:hypothetical protein